MPSVRARSPGQEPTLAPAHLAHRKAAVQREPKLFNTFDQKESVMTQLCCPRCRLRFTPAAAAYIVACPECGEPPQQITSQSALGFRLLGPEDLPIELPQAAALAIPAPEPDTRSRPTPTSAYSDC
jgi:hypothetical protein